MSHRLRRLVAALALMLAVAAPAAAAPAEKVVPASKVLPFLDAYLKLPPGERNHFVMAYYFHIGPQPLAAPVWLVQGERRTPLPLSAAGRVERLPTLAQLADAKLAVGIDPAVKFSVTLSLEPVVAPATELDARELAAAIVQASTGQKKAAGIMGMAIPRMSSVAFVGAGSGEVEFADGRRAPLPLVKGVPTYTPEAQPNARRIRLPRVPDKLDIG